MYKVAKVLLASAVIFSSAVLPASAASTKNLNPVNSGNYGVSQLSEGELIATGATRKTPYVCINSGYLNVRSNSGRRIGRIYKGQSVKVVAYYRGAYQIRYGRRFGWVSERYICYGY